MKNLLKDNPYRLEYVLILIASTMALGTLAVSTILGISMSSAILAAGIFLVIFIVLGLFNELYVLLLMMSLLYLIPYSPLVADVRSSGGSYNLFSRFSVYISPWDLMIFMVSIIWFSKNWLTGNLRFKSIEYPEIKYYTVLFIAGLLIGMLHLKGSVLSYGETKAIQTAIYFIPFYYFLVVYLFTINFIKSEKDVYTSINYIWLLSIGLLVFALLRTIGIITGNIDTLLGFGLPMILYDQANFLFLPIYLHLTFSLMKRKDKFRNILLTSIYLLLILLTTRRFFLLLLVLGTISVFFYAYKAGLIKGPRIVGTMLKIVLTLVVLGLLIMMVLPDFVTGVVDAFETINFLTEKGMYFGGETRKAEIINIIQNMNERKYAYVTGFGLGSNWQEITPVPFDIMAYTKKDLVNVTKWYPKFHLPYLSKLYRFGFGGSFLFFLVFVMFIKRSLKFIRNAASDKKLQGYVIGITVFLTVYLFESGDSTNPTPLIFCGFLYGIQTSIQRLCLKNSNDTT